MPGLIESKQITVVDELPHGKKAVWSRWEFDTDGKITKAKIRVVAKGFMRRGGAEYLRTPAPTPTAAPVKIVRAVVNEVQYKSMPPRCRTGVHKSDVGHRGVHEASRWLWGLIWQLCTSR